MKIITFLSLLVTPFAVLYGQEPIVESQKNIPIADSTTASMAALDQIAEPDHFKIACYYNSRMSSPQQNIIRIRPEEQPAVDTIKSLTVNKQKK